MKWSILHLIVPLPAFKQSPCTQFRIGEFNKGTSMLCDCTIHKHSIQYMFLYLWMFIVATFRNSFITFSTFTISHIHYYYTNKHHTMPNISYILHFHQKGSQRKIKWKKRNCFFTLVYTYSIHIWHFLGIFFKKYIHLGT